MKNYFWVAGLFLIIGACNSPASDKTSINSEESYKQPRNIILLIGDGMGPVQLQVGMLSNKGELNISKATHAGYMTTTSASDFITDSGAAGTALATGKKTYNGAIGVDENGESIPTILEMAKKSGYAVGVVATSSITHATPASFYAHQRHRRYDEAIAMDLVKSGVDVFMGGGRKFFTSRADSLNLLDSLVARNYYIADNQEDTKNSGSKKLGWFIADEQPASYLDGRGDFLPFATETALEFLSSISERGFFLMVEGSQIDWGGHANSLEYIATEMIDFDQAVGKAIDFAKADGETLVIITSDHETGGITITGGTADSLKVNFSTPDHSAAMVPVFAFGPGAELFSGILDNTDIVPRIQKAWGWDIDSTSLSAGNKPK